MFAEFDNTFDQYFGFLKNEYVSSILIIFLILYASMVAPKLPDKIALLFDNIVVKFIFFFLLAFVAKVSTPSVAVIAAIAVLITLMTVNRVNFNREMMEMVEAEDGIVMASNGDAEVILDDYRHQVNMDNSDILPHDPSNDSFCPMNL